MLNNKQQKLVEDNHKLIYFFLNKHKLSIDKWYDVCAIALCKAALKYKEETSKFSTYALTCLHHAVYFEKRTSNAQKRIPEFSVISFDEELKTESGEMTLLNIVDSHAINPYDFISNIDIQNLINKENTTMRKILYLSSLGYTQTDISKVLHISQPHVSRLINKFKAKLKDLEN